MRRTAIALFCLFLLSVGIGLRAQNIQLHYDFGRSLYDKDLKDRPVLTSTVEKFHPDKWGSTYFFVDMDYTSDGVAAAYWEIARELKFWKNPFSVQARRYPGGVPGAGGSRIQGDHSAGPEREQLRQGLGGTGGLC